MSDDNPPTKLVTETLPSKEREISALGSANAPIVFFDGVPFSGSGNGIGAITLTAERMMTYRRDAEGRSCSIVTDNIIVAHLRCDLNTLRKLRAAIDAIEEREAQLQAQAPQISSGTLQ